MIERLLEIVKTLKEIAVRENLLGTQGEILVKAVDLYIFEEVGKQKNARIDSVTQRTPQATSDKATDKQVNFLRGRGVMSVNFETLTKKEASKLIEEQINKSNMEQQQ